MSSTSLLTTVLGWTVVLGAAGYYYVNNKSKVKAKAQTAVKQVNKVVEERKEPKSKKSKKDALSSGEQDKKSSAKAEKKKSPAPQKTEPKQETVKPVANDSDDDDNDAENNRKFALQFAKTQAGTQFSGNSSSSTNRQKSVKQSRAQEKEIKDSGNMTAGDADDDQSFTDSPEVGPTQGTSSVVSGIADMLEPAAPGPSVLKVTEPTNPKPAKKEKVKAAPQPAETKKQRQNRAKIEAAKVAREQEEKERKVKEEKQRRTAREAEGRAAKDGSQFMASQAANSAWTASSANTSNAPINKFDLLDTAENKTDEKVKVVVPAENFSESEVVGTQWQGYGDDDERVKTIIEDSREWEQVSSKKKRAKKDKKEITGAEGAGTTSSTDEKEYTIPPKTERSLPGQKWTSDLTYVDSDNNVHDVQKDLQDSEWVVS
ncbi:uncharacterized protein EAF01_001575 [Botrytis porri]|uniref:Uncharacterized protein n=1 Tax=Botrytis porri TaxID=87229 RepID=A0A4Z1KQE6_9HELO|nr:uncharacterized protein EAF01_001575 [Botrytis porri]KAF7912554.1 hypothetical protein EAF01_001575 [Botrytis porri]TGO87816.1 hypothetical protein BPOR_0201g00040 [Botrytis porri]